MRSELHHRLPERRSHIRGPHDRGTRRGEGFPVTIEAGNGSASLARKPGRIVSLSPTATESLFAIGAGPQVVAVDDQSDYPAEAPKTDMSGFKPNVEAIIARKPDLVVLANDLDSIVAELGKLGIPVLLEPAATKLDEAYDQIADLGAATGNKAKADEVAADMKKQIGASSRPPRRRTTSSTYYHELDDTPYAATSEHLHRPDLRPVRPDQHRRQGPRTRPAATPSCRPSSSPRPTPT